MYEKMIDVRVIGNKTFFDLGNLAHVIGIDDPVNSRYEVFPDKVVRWVDGNLRVFLDRTDALRLAYSSRYTQVSKLACWIDVATFKHLRGMKATGLREFVDLQAPRSLHDRINAE